MVLRYEIVGPDDIPMESIISCGDRAFKDDEFHKVLFPARLAHPDSAEEYRNFRTARLNARIRTKGSHYMIAVDDDVDDGKRVLGFAGWVEPGVADPANDVNGIVEKGEEIEGDGTVDDGQGGKRGDGKKYPKIMDVQLYKRQEKAMADLRKKILGDDEKNVWCEYSITDCRWL